MTNFGTSTKCDELVANRDVRGTREILPQTWIFESMRQFYRRVLKVAQKYVATQMRGKSACLPSHYRRPSESATMRAKKINAANFQLPKDLLNAPLLTS